MRKNVKKVIAPLLAAAMALSCTVCVSAAEDETIKLTVWGAEEDQNLLKELTDKFQEKYADQKFDIQIGVESESTAKDTILTDVEAGADVYAFADDQLPDLVKAGALLKLDDYAEALQLADTTLDDVKAANVEGAIDAATIDGSLYAFPRAADNGYFLYYDSSVISEEDAASWDSLLEAADKAGKKVGMTLASGWYNASFFYGAGFTTGLNDDGTTTMDWNGTSADGYTGVDVVKECLILHLIRHLWQLLMVICLISLHPVIWQHAFPVHGMQSQQRRYLVTDMQQQSFLHSQLVTNRFSRDLLPVTNMLV